MVFGVYMLDWNLTTTYTVGVISIPIFYRWGHWGPEYLSNFSNIKKRIGTSLVVQWLRICLPMHGTWVRALVWEDLTCCGAAKPMRHNYWACTLEPTCHNYWARVPQVLKPTRLEPMLCNKRSHCNKKPVHRKEEWPPLVPTRESPRAATKTQHSQE